LGAAFQVGSSRLDFLLESLELAWIASRASGRSLIWRPRFAVGVQALLGALLLRLVWLQFLYLSWTSRARARHLFNQLALVDDDLFVAVQAIERTRRDFVPTPVLMCSSLLALVVSESTPLELILKRATSVSTSPSASWSCLVLGAAAPCSWSRCRRANG